jgi:hypothetical protein
MIIYLVMNLPTETATENFEKAYSHKHNEKHSQNLIQKLLKTAKALKFQSFWYNYLVSIKIFSVPIFSLLLPAF